MRYGLLLILLVGALFSTAAQEETETHPVDVETVSLLIDTEWSVTVQGSLGTGCDEEPTIEQATDGDTLTVQIYQELPVNTPCTMMLIPYERTITLEDTEGVKVIDVNGTIIRLESGDEPMDMVNRINHVIEDVALTTTDGDITALQVSGYQPNGCMFPVITEVTYSAGWMRVEIYRNIPAGVRCVGDEIDYTATVSVNEALTTNAAVEVNDFLALLEPGVLQVQDATATPENLLTPAEPTPLEITAIEPITGENSLVLHITGNHPSGCEFPTGIKQERVGFEIIVDVYDAMPDMSARMCPAMLRVFDENVAIEGTFEPGDYVYRVNGIEGEFTIGATN